MSKVEHRRFTAEQKLEISREAEVYLRAYDSVSVARESPGRYFAFYNTRRPHSSLDRVTPDQFYFRSLPAHQAA